MSSDDDRPSAFTDVRRGLGLLFRAARTTAKKLRSNEGGGNLEELAVTSAKEVGRAFENVASTVAGAIGAVGNEVLGKRKDDGEKKDDGSGDA